VGGEDRVIFHLLPALIGAGAVLGLVVLVVCAVVAGGRADDRIDRWSNQ
jgi:hypothetical protein